MVGLVSWERLWEVLLAYTRRYDMFDLAFWDYCRFAALEIERMGYCIGRMLCPYYLLGITGAFIT